MKMLLGKVLLICAAACSFLTTIAHMACIWLGPECYAVQLAPPILIESAKQGTLLAPIATVIVSLIFFVIGLYALSAAKLIKQLPLLSKAIFTLSILCLVRGILPIQLWLRKPYKIDQLDVNFGLGWLFVGICFSVGYFCVVKRNTRA